MVSEMLGYGVNRPSVQVQYDESDCPWGVAIA